MGDHLIGMVMDVDDDLLGAGLDKGVERVVDHRFAGDLDERFRDRIRDRAHPGAEPGGQHHRVLDRHRGQPSFSL